MVRAYDSELANTIESVYDSEKPKGLLQQLADGTIRISFYDPKEFSRGVFILKNFDSSSTGYIESKKGIANDNDILKIEIMTGGTFTYGVAPAVTYRVMGKSDLGFMLEEILEETLINGDYQDCGNGIIIKWAVGIYTAGDYYHMKISNNVIRRKLVVGIKTP